MKSAEPAIRLYTTGHDIVVEVDINGEWFELIRAHGALDTVTVDHASCERALFVHKKLSPEQWHQHHERRYLYHYAMAVETGKDVQLAPLPGSVLHEDDIEVHSWPGRRLGGQHVGVDRGGVLLVHKPTGVAVVCDEERSQLRNRQAAFEKLRTVLRGYL